MQPPPALEFIIIGTCFVVLRLQNCISSYIYVYFQLLKRINIDQMRKRTLCYTRYSHAYFLIKYREIYSNFRLELNKTVWAADIGYYPHI